MSGAARNETLPNNKGDGTFDINDPKTGQTTFGTEAIASVQPSTGAVRAMVGGPGFERYQFNLATHLPGRQPGSSMKTFVLATLFEMTINRRSRSMSLHSRRSTSFERSPANPCKAAHGR